MTTPKAKAEKRVLVELAEKLRLVGQHLEWIMGALMNQNNNLFKKVIDENQAVYEAIQLLESGKLEAQIQREVLEGLHAKIVRKEQELSEDTSIPDTDFQKTSSAFLWVCQLIDSQLKEIED